MSNLIDVVLAEDTEGTAARLERWLVKPGDAVAADAPLAEIETDKVTLEIPAPAAGIFHQALVAPGEEIAPGAILGRIDPRGEDEPDREEHAAPESTSIEIRFPAEQAEGTTATVGKWLLRVGEIAREGQAVAEIETDKVSVEVCAPTTGILQAILVVEGQPVAPGALLGRMLLAPSASVTEERPTPRDVHTSTAERTADDERISPSVRRLMSEHGLKSLEGIRGSGADGRVSRDDLLAWLGERPAAADPARPTPGLTGKRVAHSNMRRSIARHMAESLSRTPHVTSVFEADMGAVVRHRLRQREAFAEEGIKLSYSAYLLAASARAMAVVPQVNARFHADALEIFEEVNIGVGTALGDEGLIVPVVRGVERLDLKAIARELEDKTGRARAGTLTPEDLGGGTFTISNHGVSGSLLAAPIIINQPQVAILGVGKLEKRVRVVELEAEDKVRIRPMCYVSLSIDHRALDAHQTNRWLSAFVETLENWPG